MFQSTFACTIESGMPSELKTYLSDLETAQSKIANEAGKESCTKG